MTQGRQAGVEGVLGSLTDGVLGWLTDGVLGSSLTHLKAGVAGVLGMFMSTAGLLGGGDSLDEDDRAGLEASL